MTPCAKDQPPSSLFERVTQSGHRAEVMLVESSNQGATERLSDLSSQTSVTVKVLPSSSLASLCLTVLQESNNESARPQAQATTITTGKTTYSVASQVRIAFHDRITILNERLHDAANIRDDSRDYLQGVINTYYSENKATRAAFTNFENTLTDKLGLGANELQQLLSGDPDQIIGEVNEYFTSKEALISFVRESEGLLELAYEERVTSLAPLSELLQYSSEPLIQIRVHGDLIKRLPNCELPDLLKLRLTDVDIESFPEHFKAPKLEVLEVRNAPLSSLPDAELPCLKELELTETKVETFPANFRAPNLER